MSLAVQERDQPTLEEIVELAAVDSQFFGEFFFPRAFRQKSPAFHLEMDRILDDPTARLVNMQVFRGGAKTTKLRVFTAKRIAYGLAHTILYIGKSEGHAARSINWIRNQIDRNRVFAQTFSLRAGQKWQDAEAEIWHGTDEYPIWIMGMGITGSVRGINRDDFRPDLIVLDDVLDEENSSTTDQREKIKNLIYGAVKESLAPESEAPDAKLAMLQTPQNKEDASTEALDDHEWVSAVFGCWTPDTANLQVDEQESVWPERWSSEVLRKEKKAAIQRNKLSIFVREKECKLTSVETAAFREEWLRFYEPALLPERMVKVMAIDPVPPPSELQVAKGLQKKDYEALVVVGRSGADFFLLDYSLSRGHTPDWTIAEFFRLAFLWNPMRICVEATGYQRTLAWLLRKAMEAQRRFFVVKEEDTGIKSKYVRITNALNGIAANGHLYVQKSQIEFISQFRMYPDVVHEDLLEAVSVAVADLSSGVYDESEFEAMLIEEMDIPRLEYARGAP